jgi:hypothetical protein
MGLVSDSVSALDQVGGTVAPLIERDSLENIG